MAVCVRVPERRGDGSMDECHTWPEQNRQMSHPFLLQMWADPLISAIAIVTASAHSLLLIYSLIFGGRVGALTQTSEGSVWRSNMEFWVLDDSARLFAPPSIRVIWVCSDECGEGLQPIIKS